MKLACDICKEGQAFQTDNPYEMIEHLENHYRILDVLNSKILKDMEALEKRLGDKQ